LIVLKTYGLFLKKSKLGFAGGGINPQNMGGAKVSGVPLATVVKNTGKICSHSPRLCGLIVTH